MLSRCNVCESKDLTNIWDLPDFPLTGIYVDRPDEVHYQNTYPQKLQFCTNCSHAQLANQIDPSFLYRDTYTHRTSESPISASGNRFLLDFILSKTNGKNFQQVLEIGCNDLLLLQNLRDRSQNQAGVDPIWPDGIHVSEQGIRLWGGFAESVNYNELLKHKIDLIISAHTFEHVLNPIKAILSLKDQISEDCLLIIEVPSAERMLEQRRLDQVFNQHVNYYSVRSLETLMKALGFNLIDLEYNYSYWGGTQLLVFSRDINSHYDLVRPRLTTEAYKESIVDFEAAMRNASSQIENSPGPVYLYGAAQMLPSLIYHLTDSALSKITGIIDDNPARQGKFYPNFGVKISSSDTFFDLEQSTIVISALDSARPILRRLIELKPRTIIIPSGLI